MPPGGRNKALTKDEYKQLVLENKSTKRSTSMFESCLLPHDMRANPKITAQRKVEAGLKQDRQNFLNKYGTVDGTPNQLANRGLYAAELPTSPQHKKYTLSDALAKRPSILQQEDDSYRNRPKFNIPTLRKWFREIDADGGGRVTRRELIVAMRNHKELQAVLLSCVADTPDGNDMAEEDAIQAKNAELRRIMTIMQEVDTDNSGSMEWEEFVEFFRRSGFLLEYDTRGTLNDTSFKQDTLMELASFAHNVEKLKGLTENIPPAPGSPKGGSPKSPKSPFAAAGHLRAAGLRL